MENSDIKDESQITNNTENTENADVAVENRPDEKAEVKTDDKAEVKKVKHSRLSNYERHLVPCPHCGKDILDHFTECPHCHGEVDPCGYHVDEKKLARVKRISQIVGIVLSIGLIAAIIAISYVRNKDNTDAVTFDGRPAICREADDVF